MFSLKIYERYLIKSLLLATGFCFVALFSLFVFFEFLGLLSEVSANSAFTIKHALLTALFRGPSQVYQAAPIIMLIGALLTLAQFARSSELNVMRVSGISTLRLLGVLFKAAAVVAVIAFVWGEWVAPTSDRMATSLRSPSARMKSGMQLRSGFWIKDGRNFVNIRDIDRAGHLKFVQIFEYDTDGRLVALRTAGEGEYLRPNTWRLRDVSEIRYRADHSAERRGVAEELWQSDLSPDVLGDLNVRPDKMSAVTLVTYVAHLSANRQDSSRYQVALWKRVVYPMTCFVMAALALPFGYFQGRASGIGLKLFAGVMIGIVYYVADGLASNLGLLYQWPITVAALGPSIVFLAVAMSLIWWVERR